MANRLKSDDYSSSDWDLVIIRDLPIDLQSSDEDTAIQSDQMEQFDDLMQGSLTEAEDYNRQSQEGQVLGSDMYNELENTNFSMHTDYEEMSRALSEPVPSAHHMTGAPGEISAAPIPAAPVAAATNNTGTITALPALQHVQASGENDDELPTTPESQSATDRQKQRTLRLTESHDQILNRAHLSRSFTESQHAGSSHSGVRENPIALSPSDTRGNRIRAQSLQHLAYDTPRTRHSQMQDTREGFQPGHTPNPVQQSLSPYDPSQETIARGHNNIRDPSYGTLPLVHQPYFQSPTHHPHGSNSNQFQGYGRQPVSTQTGYDDNTGGWAPNDGAGQVQQYTSNLAGRSVSHNDLLQAQLERQPSSTYDEHAYPTEQVMGPGPPNQLYFPSMTAADSARASQGTAWPFNDHTMPTTNEMQCMYVEQLYDAMLDMEAPLDNPGMVAMWSRLMTREREVELTCWDILKACIKSHRQSEPLVMGGKQGKNYKCFQDHIYDICESMRLQKTICKHLFAPPYIYQLVDDPIGSAHRIANNRKVNDGKKVAITAGRIAMLKKKKAAQRLLRGSDNGEDDELDTFDDDEEDDSYLDAADDDKDYQTFRSSEQANVRQPKSSPKSKKTSKKRKSMDAGDAAFRSSTRSRPKKRSNTSIYEVVQDPITGTYTVGSRPDPESRRRSSTSNLPSRSLGPVDPALGPSPYRQVQRGQYPATGQLSGPDEQGEDPEISPEPTLPSSIRRQNRRR